MKNKLINKIIIFFLIAVVSVECFSLFFNFSLAQVVAPGQNASPRQIEVAAYMVGNDNKEIPNGEYEVRFALYLVDRTDGTALEGAPVWQETQKIVLEDGMMKGYLGAVTAIPETLNFATGIYYLGIKIGTDSEMMPRKRIGATPLAVNALDSQSVRGAFPGEGEGNLLVLGNGGKVNQSQIVEITELGTISTGVWEGDIIESSFIAEALEDKTYNGLTLVALPAGFSIANGSVSTMTITGNVGIDQSLLTTDSPTFATLNLTTLDLGINTIADGTMTGDWDFGSGNLTTTGTLTVGAIGSAGNLDMQNNLILNIGDAGTDFTAGGGLNLAGNLNANSGIDILGANLTVGGTKFTVDVADGDISAEGDFAFTGDRTLSGNGTITINPTGNLYFQSNSYFIDESGYLTTGKNITPELEYSGNITIDANSAAGTTTVTVTNQDGTQVANLVVEGDVTVNGGKITLATGETIDAETADTLKFNSNGDIIAILGDALGVKKFAVYDSTGVNETGYIDSDGNIQMDGTATFAGALTVQSGGANITGNSTITGTLNVGNVTGGTYNGNTITTGTGTLTLNTHTLSLSGSTEINQNLLTTSSPTFAGATISGLAVGATNGVVTHSAGVLQTRDIDSRVWGSSILDYSGTNTNYVPYFSDADTLTKSNIYFDGTSVGIGTTAPNGVLDIYKEISGNNLRYRNNGSGWSGALMVLESASTARANGMLLTNTAQAANAAWFVGSPYSSADFIIGSSSVYSENANNGSYMLSNAKIFIDGSSIGYVGIGTTAPGYKLSVGSADASDQIGIYHDNTNAYFRTTDGSFYFQTDEGTNTNSIIEVQGKGTGIGRFIAYDQDKEDLIDMYAFSNYGYIQTEGDNSLGLVLAAGTAYEDEIWITSNNFINIGPYDMSGITVTNNNVGIGTTSPSERLDINGTDPRIYLADADAPGTTTNRMYSVSGDLFWDGVNLSAGGALPAGTEGQTLYSNGGVWTANSTLYYDDGNSRVGIGTTSPSANLNIYQDSPTPDQILFQIGTSGNASRFVIDEDGDVAINVSSAKLYLAGMGSSSHIDYDTFQSGSAAGININSDDVVGNIRFQVLGSEKMRVSTNGNVGIGTTAPSYGLDLSGTLRVTGNTLFSGNTHDFYQSVSPYSTVNIGRGTTQRFSMTVNDSTGTMTSYQQDEVTGNHQWVFNIVSSTSGRQDYKFKNNDNDLLLIDKSGNIGIGTTAPNERLDINGTDPRIYLADAAAPGTTTNRLYSVGGNLTWNGINLSSGGALPVGTEGQTLYSNGGVWTANNTLYYDDVNSRVGIGTTAPGYKLSVGSANASDQIGIYHDNADAYFKTTDGSFYFQTDEGTNNNTAVVVKGKGTGRGHFVAYDEDDDVSIQMYGYLNWGMIQVVGDNAEGLALYAGNDANDELGFASDNIVLGYDSDINFLVNGAGDIGIMNGNVGIGTTSPIGRLSIGKGSDVAGEKVWNVTEQANFDMYTNTWDSYRRYLDITSLGGYDGAAGGGVIRFITNPNDSATGIERMRIAETGNVGIGTTSPNERLDINGTDPRIYLADAAAPGTTTNRLYSVGGNLTWNGINLSAGGALPVGTEGQTLYSNGGVWTANNTLFYDDVNSRVGIGTTSPGAKLEVKSSGAGTYLIGRASDGSIGLSLNETAGGHNYFDIMDASGTTQARLSSSGYTYFNGGNVGIGTTSPGVRLTVKSSGTAADQIALIRSSDANQIFHVREDGTGNAILALYDASNNEDIAFNTAGNSWFNNAGNVGIGTTAPSGKFSLGSAAGENAYFFYDNADVGNGTNGQALYVYRRADEGDSYISLQMDSAMQGMIKSNKNLEITTAGTQLILRSDQANGIVYVGDPWTTSSNVNTSVRIPGYITAAGANRYAQFRINDTTDNLELSRQDSNIGYFDVQMPTIFTGGNVGIGTTSPVNNLQVSGSAADPSLVVGTNNGIITMRSGTADLEFGRLVNSPYGVWMQTRWNDSEAAAQLIINPLGGNVGIGTTSPTQKLTVGGNINMAGGWIIGDAAGNWNADNIQVHTSVWDGASLNNWGHLVGGHLYAYGGLQSGGDDGDEAGGGELYVYGKSMLMGNVGIGTTSPGADLEIYSDSAQNALSVTANSDDYIKFTQYGELEHSTGPVIGWDTNVSQGTYSDWNDLYLTSGKDSGSAYDILMMPSNGGNVGIGTTAPQNKLHIEGTAASYAGIYMNDAAPGTTTATLYNSGGNLYWGTTNLSSGGALPVGTEGQTLYSNGGTWTVNNTLFYDDVNSRVGIGTTAPGDILEIEGALGGKGLTIDSSQGAGIVLDRGSNAGYSMIRYATAGGESWWAGMFGNSTENYYIGDSSANPFFTIVDNGSTGNVGIGTTAPGTKLQIGTGTSGHSATGLYVGSDGDALVSEFDGMVYFDAGTKFYNTIEVENAQAKFYAGIYSYGALQLNNAGTDITTYDTNQDLTIDPNGTGDIILQGNVGIGTTGPNRLLNVYGGTAGAETIMLELRSGFNDANTATTLKFVNSTTAGSNYGTGEISAVRLASGGGSKMIFRTDTLGTLYDRMTIDNSGNVGIGTTIPGYKLEVSNGSANTTVGDFTVDTSNHIVYVGQLNTSSGNTALVVRNRVGTEKFRVNSEGVGNAYFTGFNSGYGVGIGITTPTGRLHIVGDNTNPALYVSGGSGYAAIFNSGNVGIGTTDPDSDLHISSPTGETTLTLGGTGNSNSYINFLDSAGNKITQFYAEEGGERFYIGHSPYGTTRLMINENGNVGIGTTAPGQKLHVVGAFNLNDQILLKGSSGQLQLRNTADNGWGDLQVGTITMNDDLYMATGEIGPEYNEQAGSLILTGGFNSAAPAGAKITLYGASHATNANQTIIENGNVGIGSTGPGARLHVVGANDLSTSFAAKIGGATTTGLVIQNNGNVGIGTTGPDKKLQITDTSSGNLIYQLKLSNRGNATGTGVGIVFNNENQEKGGLVYIEDAAIGWGKGDFHFLQNTGANNNSATIADSVFTIKNNGYVGIGTTTPELPLVVSSAVGAGKVALFGGSDSSTSFTSSSGQLQVVNRNSTTNNWARLSFADSNSGSEPVAAAIGSQFLDHTNNYGNLVFWTRDSVSFSEKMRIDSGGNVGIGTTAPDRSFHVYGDGIGYQAIIERQEAGSDAAISFKNNNDQWTFGYNDASSAFIISDSTTLLDSPRLSILSSTGNVGIGTTSPNERLDINGTDPRIYLADATAPGTTTNRLYSVGGNLTWNGINLSSGGALPVGTEGQTLYSNGGVWTANNTLYYDDVNSRVGIGTTAPGALLHISSTAAQNLFQISDDGNGDDSPFVINQYGEVAIQNDTSVYGASLEVYDWNDGEPSFVVSSSSTGDIMRVYDASNQVFTIADGGNVGIGTTDPKAKLDVVSSSSGVSIIAGSSADLARQTIVAGSTYDAQLSFGEGTSDSFNTRWSMGNDGTNDSFHINNAYGTFDGTSEFTILTGGNVGIGTTSPVNNLHIKTGTDGGGLTIQRNSTSANAYADLKFSITDTDSSTPVTLIRAYRRSAYDDTDLLFTVGGTDALMIRDSGNVGIGTTSPVNNLQVSGSAADPSLVVGTNNGIITMRSGTADLEFGRLVNSPYGVWMQTRWNDSEAAAQLIINPLGGNVGIGTTAPGAHLVVGADTNRTYADGTGDVYIASDLEVDGTLYTSAVSPTGSIIPSANDTYDLGSDALRWKDLYLGGETLHIGASTSDEGYLSYTSGTNVFNLQSTGNIALQPTSGNVGIGTTSPGSLLEVNGDRVHIKDAYSEIGLGADRTNNRLTLENNTNIGLVGKKNVWLGIDSDNSGTDATFGIVVNDSWLAGTESPVFVVTEAGNVGIGTTAPGAKLEVALGTVASQNGLNITGYDNDTTLYPLYIKDENNNEDFWIKTDAAGGATVTTYIRGNVGIGTTSPLQKLHVNGQCMTGDTLLPIRRRRRRRKNALGEDEDDELNPANEIDENGIEWDYLFCPIREILPGDEVLTLDEGEDKAVYRKIKALMDMGEKEIFELKTKSGRVIRTTANHPYLVQSSKLKVKSESLGIKNLVEKFKKLGRKYITFGRGEAEICETREIEAPENREMKSLEPTISEQGIQKKIEEITKNENSEVQALEGSVLEVSCPYCESKNYVKRGTRKKKLEIVQLYICRDCGRTFTPKAVKGKRYPLSVILNAISLYNLGHSLEKVCEALRKIGDNAGSVTATTVSNWIAQFSPLCRFARLREYALRRFRAKDFIETATLAHRQLYRFRYHRAKTAMMIFEDFRHAKYQPLREFLENITSECPHQYFQEGLRASEAPLFFSKKEMIVRGKENYATRLAKFVLESVGRNRDRHEALQKFMLINDSVTVATEVPVYLKKDDLTHMQTQLGFKLYTKPDRKKTKKNNKGEDELLKEMNTENIPKLITGHIDMLQIRNGLVHILDYKPKAEKERPVEQLTLYALALSRLTGLRLFNFKCAWFDEKDYFEFYPLHCVYKPGKRRRKKVMTIEGEYRINRREDKFETIRARGDPKKERGSPRAPT